MTQKAKSKRQRSRKYDLVSRADRVGRLLRDELATSNDRSFAISAITMIEHSLEACVRKFLTGAMSADQPIVDGALAPLSTFYAKTMFAHAAGLISDDLNNDLNTLRSIRNYFAHALRSEALASPEVKRLIAKLDHIWNGTTAPNQSTPERGRFLAIIMAIQLQLMATRSGIKPCRKAMMEDLYVESRVMAALDIQSYF